MQWPEDKELSRLYREMPEAIPGPALKSRVLAAAIEQAGKRINKVVPLHRRWAVPVGLAASVVLCASLFLFQSSPPVAPEITPQSNPSAPGQRETAAVLPHNIRMAQVEPGVPISKSRSQQVVNVLPSDPMQASAGISDPQSKEFKLPLVTSPEARLDEIRTLKKLGKHDEVKMQLRRFRKDYPDYSLPDEFKPAP